MSFKAAAKGIYNQSDFEAFQKSESCKSILDFVKDCADSVVGYTISDHVDVVDPIAKFVNFMNRLYELVDEIPPLKQPMRFGNKAFRVWHERLSIESSAFLQSILSESLRDAAIELTPYILEMFGNVTRIDYGTGHELNFAIFFMLLLKLGVIVKTDLRAVVLRGFVAYLRLMRRLQTEYMLEPAGSHGVWGLDDYHCLLFLWGAAQLATRPTPVQTSVSTVEEAISNAADENKSVVPDSVREPHDLRPSSVLDMAVLQEYASEYLYLEGILFIRRIKASAPFAETSPMLHDISAVSDWARVCSGLMRLFQGEVLFKFPVAQHILFGSLLPCTWRPDSATTVVSATIPAAGHS